MKTKTTMKSTMAAIASGLALTGGAFAASTDFPAPLPGFKNDVELVEWRNELIAKAEAEEAAPITASDTSQIFYTGKPFVEDTGEYSFLFRNYNPEFARWSSEDPSGFPDGANNLAYMAVPTFEFDWLGLATKKIAWVYWSPSNFGGSGGSGSMSKLMSHHITEATTYMHEKDNETNSSTAYLSDGDYFHSSPYTVSTIASINNLFANDGYTKLVLFAHGYHVEFEGYTWGGEDTYYSTSVFGSNANDIFYATCYNAFSPNPTSGHTGGALIGELFAPSKQVTKDYLYE